MRAIISRSAARRRQLSKGWNGDIRPFNFTPLPTPQVPAKRNFLVCKAHRQPTTRKQEVLYRLYLFNTLRPGKYFAVNIRSWLQKLTTRLHNFKSLKDGWNGYAAPAPSEKSLHFTHLFLLVLNNSGIEPSRIAPSAVGGVGVTHRRGPLKVYTEFFDDGTVHALFSDDEKKEMYTRSVVASINGYQTFLRELRKYLNA